MLACGSAGNDGLPERLGKEVGYCYSLFGGKLVQPAVGSFGDNWCRSWLWILLNPDVGIICPTGNRAHGYSRPPCSGKRYP